MFKLIFLILVLILALSYFGISAQAILSSPAGQENMIYTSELIAKGWHWLASAVHKP